MKFAEKFGRNVYSQMGEDGIIEEILKRIDPVKYCCEFGGNDAKFCSNTYHLLKQGWKGLMIEGNGDFFADAIKNLIGFDCNYQVSAVTPDNVNKLVPQDLGLLSMDTDGPDAGIWQAYTGSPDIVIIEINSSLDPEIDFYSPEKGANYSYMKKLGESKGYFLLCHTGNLIFLLNKYKELFADRCEDFNTSWR